MSEKGTFKTFSGRFVRWGRVEIDSDKCTLCLSCAGACNTGALFADASQNALKFNASLCTTCGYCEASCAEADTIKVIRDGMGLEGGYFDYQILARDELFACVECGKEFATKKAVLKVYEMMAPLFGGDEKRTKTLLCCAECKAKMMILGADDEL